MKKGILVAAALCMGIAGRAQMQNYESANNYLRNSDYDHAKEYVGMALNDPSTKNKPKVWKLQGDIYMVMLQDSAYMMKNAAKMKMTGPESPFKMAMKSYMKVVELDPEFEKDEINMALLAGAFQAYMGGRELYNAKQYGMASEFLKDVIDIHDLGKGKRFAGQKKFDTVSAEAQTLRAYSAYYQDKYDEAIPMFTALKEDPITRDPNVYIVLMEIYSKQKKDAELLAITQEAKKAYPNDPNITNRELNYYISSGKQDEVMKKLEEAAAKDPNNVEVQVNLGNGYSGLAFPKDANKKDAPKPANYAELTTKAETAYSAAVKLKPEDAGINYGLGALYYNQGADYNKQSNAIAGTNKEEMKQIDELVAKRDQYFTKALPYLEKSYNTLDAKAASVSGDERMTYLQSILALREIYTRQNKLDKSAELKKKFDAANK